MSLQTKDEQFIPEVAKAITLEFSSPKNTRNFLKTPVKFPGKH